MKGCWGFWKDGIMLNEGNTPINMTILFPWSQSGFFFYIYFFGKRWHTK